jgi:hypothetical protein
MAIHFYLTFGQSSYEMAFYAKMQLNNYKLRQSLAGMQWSWIASCIAVVSLVLFNLCF